MTLGGTYGNVPMSSCREMAPLSEELHQRQCQLLLETTGHHQQICLWLLTVTTHGASTWKPHKHHPTDAHGKHRKVHQGSSKSLLDRRRCGMASPMEWVETRLCCLGKVAWWTSPIVSCCAWDWLAAQQRQFRLLGSGYLRSGCMFQQYDGTKQALKMKSYASKRGFDECIWDKHWYRRGWVSFQLSLWSKVTSRFAGGVLSSPTTTDAVSGVVLQTKAPSLDKNSLVRCHTSLPMSSPGWFMPRFFESRLRTTCEMGIMVGMAVRRTCSS